LATVKGDFLRVLKKKGEIIFEDSLWSIPENRSGVCYFLCNFSQFNDCWSVVAEKKRHLCISLTIFDK